MNENNTTNNSIEPGTENLDNVSPVNSNNSEQLNTHYYANENYNQHGAYDPNFNAGMSSYQPKVEQTQSTSETDTVENPTSVPVEPSVKPKKDYKKIILIAASIVVLAVVAFLVYKLLFNKEKLTYENFTETESFFITDSDGNYALFNEDGKQLTDFEYEYAGSFYGGAARVYDKEGRYGVIKENGEYLIPLSEDFIYGNYGLYEVVNSKLDKTQIQNFNGSVIAEANYLDVDSYAYGALFTIVEYDDSYRKLDTVKVVNYAGNSMGTLTDADSYTYYSYDGGYVTLISDTKTVLYNIDEAKKVIELDGKYCISDSTDKTVILNSCTTWSSTTDDNLYKVIIDGKIAYTVSKEDKTLNLATDGSVLSWDKNSKYYELLDKKGNVVQSSIIGYQDGKNYIVEQDDRLMFYKNNERKNILDCATYYQNASDKLYIIKVDRYADKCKGDIDNQYSYYDLAGNKKSKDFYSASKFNDAGRAIVSTDNLENYIINDKFEILGDSHYQMREVGNLYIVWDEKHNQALIDKNGKVLESVVEDYVSYGSSEDDKSYIIVETAKNTQVLYDSQTGKKISTVSGEVVYAFQHYFTVDGNYYSYKTGKLFYSKN